MLAGCSTVSDCKMCIALGLCRVDLPYLFQLHLDNTMFKCDKDSLALADMFGASGQCVIVVTLVRLGQHRIVMSVDGPVTGLRTVDTKISRVL